MERFRAATVPCIVRFRTQAMGHAVDSALRFVCVAEHRDEIDAVEVASTCYSGEGRAIAPDDVVDVETL